MNYGSESSRLGEGCWNGERRVMKASGVAVCFLFFLGGGGGAKRDP